MDIGKMLRDMLGGGTDAIAQQALAGSTPGAGGDTQPPVGTDPATTTPAQPQAYTSPPQLMELYTDLLDKARKQQNIDRGIGLIGSSLAFEENRPGIMAAFNNRSGQPNPADMLSTIAGMQEKTTALQNKAAQRAALPAIAKQYGLSLETAQYLFDAGTLDTVISEAEKPQNEIVANEDGTHSIIDKSTGKVGDAFGSPKKREIEIVKDEGTGEQFGVYKDTKERVGGPPIVPAGPSTADQRDYQAYLTDEKTRGNAAPKSFEEWRLTKPPSTKIDMSGNVADASKKKFAEKSGENFADDYQTIRKAADNANVNMGQYDAAEKALASGTRTGFGAEAELAIRKMLQATGLSEQDTTKMAAGELVTALGNRMAAVMRNPESGMGMPGSVSDRDLDFLKGANIGMGSTPQGNALMVKVFKKFEQRKIEIAKLANKFVKQNGELNADFDDEVRVYAEANPLFDDLDIKAAAVDPNAKEESIDDLVNRYNEVKK